MAAFTTFSQSNLSTTDLILTYVSTNARSRSRTALEIRACYVFRTITFSCCGPARVDPWRTYISVTRDLTRPQSFILIPITPRAPLIEDSFVALQLCPPLQFGPFTYQPIEWGFISSNQSALWSCLLHVTSQLGEGCSMSFVRFSVLIVWKTCIWNSTVLTCLGAFSLMGFWRILQKFEVCSKLSSVNAYFHMLES